VECHVAATACGVPCQATLPSEQWCNHLLTSPVLGILLCFARPGLAACISVMSSTSEFVGSPFIQRRCWVQKVPARQLLALYDAWEFSHACWQRGCSALLQVDGFGPFVRLCVVKYICLLV